MLLTQDIVNKIDAIFLPWDTRVSPGCVCAVMHAGQVLYCKGFGMADLEHDIPITPDSVFYISSTAKQFTAASIALLAIDGKLSLEDDIQKYFPELHDFGHPITLGNLVHHTSGIRDFKALLALLGWTIIDHIDNRLAMKLLTRQRTLNFLPGSRFMYGDSNYILLAEVVRRVTGKALPEFAKEMFFGPLEMNRTRIEDDVREVVANRVISYAPKHDGTGYWQFIKTIEAYGPGNVLTTGGDLARWEENFYSGKVSTMRSG
jgi:CubicO group peptidase (beta-lactamase class C family)